MRPPGAVAISIHPSLRSAQVVWVHRGHTRWLQKRLPNCESLIVPGVSHPILEMAPRVVAQHIAEFVHGHWSEENGRAH